MRRGAWQRRRRHCSEERRAAAGHDRADGALAPPHRILPRRLCCVSVCVRAARCMRRRRFPACRRHARAALAHGVHRFPAARPTRMPASGAGRSLDCPRLRRVANTGWCPDPTHWLDTRRSCAFAGCAATPSWTLPRCTRSCSSGTTRNMSHRTSHPPGGGPSRSRSCARRRT